jgi:hypothetical protein
MSVMRWDLGLAIVDISSLTVPMLLGDGDPRTISEDRSKTQCGLLEEHDLSLAAITPAFQPNNE